MTRINLRKTHPQLYRAILACGLVYISIGALAFFATPDNPEHTRTPQIVSTILNSSFILFGIVKILALHKASYKVLQIVQSIGLAYVLFYAIIFVVGSIATFDRPETRQFLWFIPVWLFWVFAQFLTIIENPYNPATMKLGGKDNGGR